MKLSFIIPAKNEASEIEWCLKWIHESMRKFVYQGRCNYEIIVVDNGSDDCTGQLADSWGARVIKFPAGKSIASVRNRGSQEATGDVWIFTDADSRVNETLIAETIFSIENGIEAGGCALAIIEPTWIGDQLCKIWNFICAHKNWYTGSYIFMTNRLGANPFNPDVFLLEDLVLSNALNKCCKTRYISCAHISTSARKLWMFSLREHVGFWLSLLFCFKYTITHPHKLWYEIRR